MGYSIVIIMLPITLWRELEICIWKETTQAQEGKVLIILFMWKLKQLISEKLTEIALSLTYHWKFNYIYISDKNICEEDKLYFMYIKAEKYILIIMNLARNSFMCQCHANEKNRLMGFFKVKCFVSIKGVSGWS